jgi:TonB family protein
MTVRWNANQPQVLKRAFVMVNATEVIIIIGIVLAIRVATRPIPITVPDDTPVIEIRYHDAVFNPPPTIIPDVPLPMTENPVPQEIAIGLVVPTPDKDALEQAGPTQRQLKGALAPDPGAISNDVVIKVVPDTAPAPPAPNPEPAVIPSPRDFVRTTVPPQVVRIPEPRYPDHCRVLGVEGTAWVQMLLALDGSVMEARVAKASGHEELDSAAVQAARQGKFTPAIGGNQKPVHVWVSMPFTFKLER